MKRKGKATGGDAKREAIDACHAIRSESSPTHKEKTPSVKESTEMDRFYGEKATAKEQNQETTEAASSVNAIMRPGVLPLFRKKMHVDSFQQSNASNKGNKGSEVNPHKRPGQCPTYELYRQFGSGVGNYIIDNITSSEFEDFGGTLLGKEK